MKLKTVFAAVVCLTCVVAPLLYAQKGGGNSDVVATITKLENDSNKADLANDPSFIQKNTTDDYISGWSTGEWQDKAAELKDMGDTANNKMTSSSIADLKVNVYGNAAIARYSKTYDSTHHGQPLARTVLCTDTWVKQGSAWKEAASHCSQKAQ